MVYVTGADHVPPPSSVVAVATEWEPSGAYTVSTAAVVTSCGTTPRVAVTRSPTSGMVSLLSSKP